MGRDCRCSSYTARPSLWISHAFQRVTLRVSRIEAMKIVHLLLTHSFAGTERHVVELANAQAETDEVWVILHRRAAENRATAFAHRFDPRVRQVQVGGWGFWTVIAARRAVQRLAPDIAHAHLSGACRALSGLKGLCPRIATLHIHFKPQQHQKMDALIAIAPWQLAQIPEPLRRRTEHIDNWSQAGPVDWAARRRVRQQWGIADDEIVFGALGRTERSKGLDQLIQAMIKARPEKCRLVIVGGGRDWKHLRRVAPPDVLMPGFVERPQEWFSAFDVFVSSARSEPFGLVFLEAMSAGLPVLATATQGAQHFAALIERALVPVDNVAALSAAVGQIARERPARRSYALDQFRRAPRVAQVRAFYERVLAEFGVGRDA
jgi:glycosyltransferase involved in cell wall biosynthesis